MFRLYILKYDVYLWKIDILERLNIRNTWMRLITQSVVDSYVYHWFAFSFFVAAACLFYSPAVPNGLTFLCSWFMFYVFLLLLFFYLCILFFCIVLTVYYVIMFFFIYCFLYFIFLFCLRRLTAPLGAVLIYLCIHLSRSPDGAVKRR